MRPSQPEVTEQPAPNAPQLGLTSFATGLKAPVVIASNGLQDDYRLFVVEQAGTIRIVSGTGEVQTTPFLDLTSKVLVGTEMGLLGLAFDPSYSQNGYFYVNYIDKQQNTIIARYGLNPATGLADPQSEKVLLKVKQPYQNHNGGDLAFGPDGYLYIPLGDGGSGGDPENRGQDKRTLLGKLLRIDVSKGDPYSVPTDNPFVNEAGTKPEIWALGLRNPWRISFDSQTGDLYIADVGQNKYEEINVLPASNKGGQNYGWRCYEASHTYNTSGCKDASTYTLPIVEYAHDQGRCSVTGGAVYRGEETQLRGKYFYGDYCGGQIYFLEQKNGEWVAGLGLQTNYKISTFGQDNANNLYLADVESGTIYLLADMANN